MSIRVVFAGTPDFSVATLEALIEAGYDVVAVYTQPDRPRGRGKRLQPSPVKAKALQHEIPVIQPLNFKSEESIQQFQELQADLMVVVAYGIILPKEILTIPTYGCLNIHASLLPRWRGAAPLHRAIEAGDRESGIAIMQMDEGLDTGPVWQMARYPITAETTTGMLHDALMNLGAKTLIETLPEVIAGKRRPTPQEEVGVTYAEKIARDEAKIDWSEPAELLQRKIHAFNPIPGAFTYLNGQLIKIFDVRLEDEMSNRVPGSLVTRDERLWVVAGDQRMLEIITLQAAGRRKMATAQFLQGNDLIDEVFNS